MSKKIKIFGKKIEWYDIRTKLKKLTRGFFYLSFVQNLITSIIFFYLWFVYLTSKKNFINFENLSQNLTSNKAFILANWHNRLIMAPFLGRYILKKTKYKNGYMTLASKHGDGRFVGKVMEKFDFENISGSSRDGRGKASRGIDVSVFRHLIKNLKKGKSLGITPDGPRGPNQKINGAIIEIAKVSDTFIIPVSYSSSKFIEFKSWDRLKLPLPFSTIKFYCGDIFVADKNIDNEILKKQLEEKMNQAQKASEF